MCPEDNSSLLSIRRRIEATRSALHSHRKRAPAGVSNRKTENLAELDRWPCRPNGIALEL